MESSQVNSFVPRRVPFSAVIAILAALVLAPAAATSADIQAAATSVGTAFAYQGYLSFNNTPANGTYDFQFSLYDAPASGNLVAGPVSADGINVVNGLFTTQIDFGAGAFTGMARWLQIAVGPSGSGQFTTLSPLRPIDPVPYATYATSAGTASNATYAASAGDASTVGGVAPSGFIANSTSAQNASFNVTGTGTIEGNATVGGNLSVAGSETVGALTASSFTAPINAAVTADTDTALVGTAGSYFPVMSQSITLTGGTSHLLFVTGHLVASCPCTYGGELDIQVQLDGNQVDLYQLNYPSTDGYSYPNTVIPLSVVTSAPTGSHVVQVEAEGGGNTGNGPSGPTISDRQLMVIDLGPH